MEINNFSRCEENSDRHRLSEKKTVSVTICVTI